MSVKWMSDVFNCKTGLSPTDKMVLLKLADHADDDGRCFPSQNRIAAACEVSTRTVRRSMQTLEAGGWVKVTRSRGADGKNELNHYRLYPPDKLSTGSSGLAPDPDEEADQRTNPTVTSGQTSGQTSGHPCPTNHHTNHHKNHQGNHQGAPDWMEDAPQSNPIDDWLMVQGDFWFRALRSSGCKIGKQNWPTWKALLEGPFRNDLPGMIEVAMEVPATQRWPDHVETRFTTRGQRLPSEDGETPGESLTL